jgi:hypothetical protein
MLRYAFMPLCHKAKQRMVQYLKHPEPSIQPAQEHPLDLRHIVTILAVPLFVPVTKVSCNLAMHSHFQFVYALFLSMKPSIVQLAPFCNFNKVDSLYNPKNSRTARPTASGDSHGKTFFPGKVSILQVGILVSYNARSDSRALSSRPCKIRTG